MVIGVFLFLAVVGVLIGTGQAKGLLIGLGALGIGVLILLTPVAVFLAYCAVVFVLIESYETLGPLGPVAALLTPGAVASLWKRVERLNTAPRPQARPKDSVVRSAATSKPQPALPPTWGEQILKAPDIRKAYPPTRSTRMSDRRGPYG
jgi:hypothetical protein